MTQLWFERKFDFTFPAGDCSKICERLRAAPARLKDIACIASREDLVRKPGNDKWSAQEHAGHLFDLESLWLARVGDYENNAAELTAADLSNRKTFDARHHEESIQAIVIKFQEARSRLLQKAENIDPAILSHAIPHPRLKTPMRLVDHLYFVAEHDDHHLEAIRELLSRTPFRT
jgi:uncharacterized damage-inducible protein DinB